jgi:LCP family protein required for cell wall assembly
MGKQNRALLSVLFLIIVVATALFVLIRGLSSGDLTSLEQDPGVVTMLLLGTDRNYDTNGGVAEEYARTDTVILACLNTKKQEAYLFSIPRDTMVDIPGRGRSLMNAAHVYGGPQLAVETVENLLRVNIPYWAVVDFDGFQDLVNALGGVEIEIEKDMKYYDRAGGFKIDLKAGKQVLDGEEALQYVRFRHDALGDIGRVRRQQKLLGAAAQKALSWQSISRWPAMYKAAERNVQTNMTQMQIAKIGAYLRKVGLEKIETRTLPGNFSGNHWRMDEPAARGIVASALAP